QRLGTLVSAASLTAYESTARTARVASLVFASAVLLCVMIVARWAIAAALRPVARMTAEAAQRSEHELDRRFAVGEPHDELTRLAATFDALLDRLAASLRRERSFSAELSHELRTPLSKLAGEADLALRRERAPEEYRRALEAIRAGAEQMRRTLETLLAAARAETAGGRGTSDARDAMRAAAGACAGHAGEREVRGELDTPPGPVRVGAGADVVERIL